MNEKDGIDVNAVLEILNENDNMVVCDGKNGFGQV